MKVSFLSQLRFWLRRDLSINARNLLTYWNQCERNSLIFFMAHVVLTTARMGSVVFID